MRNRFIKSYVILCLLFGFSNANAGDKHYSKPGISLTATGATLLFTTENGTRRFYVRELFVEVTAATVPLGAANVSFGTNAASYDNVKAAGVLTGLLDVNSVLPIPLTLVNQSIAPNTPVYINVTVGASADAQQGKVICRGFYE